MDNLILDDSVLSGHALAILLTCHMESSCAEKNYVKQHNSSTTSWGLFGQNKAWRSDNKCLGHLETREVKTLAAWFASKVWGGLIATFILSREDEGAAQICRMAKRVIKYNPLGDFESQLKFYLHHHFGEYDCDTIECIVTRALNKKYDGVDKAYFLQLEIRFKNNYVSASRLLGLQGMTSTKLPIRETFIKGFK